MHETRQNGDHIHSCMKRDKKSGVHTHSHMKRGKMVTYFASVFAAKNFAMNKAFTSLNTKCGYYVLGGKFKFKNTTAPG